MYMYRSNFVSSNISLLCKYFVDKMVYESENFILSH